MPLPASPRHFPTWGEHAKYPSTPEEMYEAMNNEHGQAGDNTHYGWSELNKALGMEQPVGLVILRGIKWAEIPTFMRNNCILEVQTGLVWQRMTIDGHAMVVRQQGPRGGLRWA
jgi:hypothetical protein